MELDPHCVFALRTWLRILFDAGDHEEMFDAGLDALDTLHSKHRAWVAVAEVLVHVGLAEEALRVLDAAVPRAGRPNTETARLAAATRVFAHLYLGRYPEAVESAQQFERAGGVIDGHIAWGLAMAHLRRGHCGKARRVLEREVVRQPGNPGLWWLLGHVERASRARDAEERARAAWRTGVAKVQANSTGIPGNPRVAAWLACLFGCLGEVTPVHQIKAHLAAFENGYLLCRIAVAEAELGGGHARHAVETLRVAAARGFRAGQQLRQEQGVSGLGRLAGDPAYEEVLALLDGRTAAFRERLETSGTWQRLDELDQ
jgi:hypothetical protein